MLCARAKQLSILPFVHASLNVQLSDNCQFKAYKGSQQKPLACDRMSLKINLRQRIREPLYKRRSNANRLPPVTAPKR